MAIRHDKSWTVRAMNWLVNTRMNSKKPIAFAQFYRELQTETGNKMTMATLNDCMKKKLRNPEQLEGFNLYEKVHMIFLLSVPVVNGEFKDLLKNAGTLELDEHHRITLFRSNDKQFVRSGAHRKWTGKARASTNRDSFVNNSESAYYDEDDDDIFIEDPVDVRPHEVRQLDVKPEDDQIETKPVPMSSFMNPINVAPVVQPFNQFPAQPTYNAFSILSFLQNYAITLDSNLLDAFRIDVSNELRRPGRENSQVTEEDIDSGLQQGLNAVLKNASPNLEASMDPLRLLEFLRTLKLLFLNLGLPENGAVVSRITHQIQSARGNVAEMMIPMTRVQYALQCLLEYSTPAI